MAQKELLLPIIVLLCWSLTAIGEETFYFKQDDLEFAQDLTAESRKMTLFDIKAKWWELQQILGKKGQNMASQNQDVTQGHYDPEESVTFQVFVSHSMSKNLLRAYAKAAKKYGAVLVFNGLPAGSWQELSRLVTEISGDDPELVAIQINDQAFGQYGITLVPSFVLSREEEVFSENPKITFDKVAGSVSIRRALEIFAGGGELQEIASNKLVTAGANE